MEALHRDASRRAEGDHRDAPHLDHRDRVLRGPRAVLLHVPGAREVDEQECRRVRHPTGIPGVVRRRQRPHLGARLRPGPRPGGQAAHRKRPGHLGAAALRRRPARVGPGDGDRGAGRDAAPGPGDGERARRGPVVDEHPVAGAPVLPGGRQRRVRVRRAGGVLLQRAAAVDAEPVLGAGAADGGARELRELARGDRGGVAHDEGRRPGWIPDDLNDGHLERFFWLLAAMSALNLAAYVYCATHYKRKSVS